MSSKESAIPAIIHVSREAFRMYSSLSRRTNRPEASAEEEGERVERKQRPFKDYEQAFFLAAALGIIDGSKMKIEGDKEQLLRTEFLKNDDNYKPMRQLIRSKYDVKDDREVLELMTEFAEHGIRELHATYQKTNSIDFFQIAERVE